MDSMALEGSISDINQKLDMLASMFNDNNEDKKQGFFSKLESTFSSEKKDKDKRRRLSQKENVYQAVPIVIDSISIDGKKELRKTFKDIFSFAPIDAKKPDMAKRSPLGALLTIIGFIIGFIIGAVEGIYKKLKGFFAGIVKFVEDIFKFITDSKIGKMIGGLFNSIGAKIMEAINFLRESKIGQAIEGFFKTIWETVKGWIKAIEESPIIKTIKEFFEAAKSKATGIIEAVMKFFGDIKSFFAPVTNFFKNTKIGELFNVKLFENFFGIFSKIFKGLEAGLKWGKTFADFLFPIIAVLETIVGVFQAYNDPKLKDASNAQKIITGVLKGLLNTFDLLEIIGLDLIKFDEIRDRVDKIFKSFNEDGFIMGILQVFNQIASFIIGIPIKVLGWVVGWINKDMGEAITKFGENFDIAELTQRAIDSIIDGVTGLWNKVVEFLKNMFGFISDYLTWDNLKKLITLDWTNIKPASKTEEPTKVNDLVDTGDRLLFSKGDSFTFDKDDDIFAMKKGGPLEALLNDRQTDASPSDASLKELTAVVRELNSNFKQYTDLNARIQTDNVKLMNENVDLLKDIRDKKGGSANVMVQNTANNTSFSNSTPSNLNYRRELSERITF